MEQEIQQYEKMYGLYTGEEIENVGPVIDQNQDQHQIEDQMREHQLNRDSAIEEQDYVAGEAENDDMVDYD